MNEFPLVALKQLDVEPHYDAFKEMVTYYALEDLYGTELHIIVKDRKPEFSFVSSRYHSYESVGPMVKTLNLPHLFKGCKEDYYFRGTLLASGYKTPPVFYVDSVYSLEQECLLPLKEATTIAYNLGVKHSPVVKHNSIFPEEFRNLFAYTKGLSVINPKLKRKGLIYRTNTLNISFVI